MVLTGSGASDPRWLDKIVQHPPTYLSELEYWIGPLEVDFAGGEGTGFVMRTRSQSAVPRGAMRKEVARLSAKFRWDMHHQEPTRPRDMSLESFTLALDIGHATVNAQLAQKLGSGNTIQTKDGPVIEFGTWWYLRMLGDGSAELSHETVRPEWALPPVLPDSREHLLIALFDRLVTDTNIDTIHSAIADLVGPAGAEIHRWNEGQLALSFRPGLEIATVMKVFRWDEPIASSGDVHMSSWSMYPKRPREQYWDPHVGPWFIDMRLDGWPRGPNRAELPTLPDRGGASSTYDVRGCANKVESITVRRPYR